MSSLARCVDCAERQQSGVLQHHHCHVQGLHRTPCLTAFTPCLITTLASLVLAVGVSLIWLDSEDDFPVGAFVVVLLLAIFLPCVGLVSATCIPDSRAPGPPCVGLQWEEPSLYPCWCLHSTFTKTLKSPRRVSERLLRPCDSCRSMHHGRKRSNTALPRAVKVTHNKPAAEGTLGETGAYRNVLAPELAVTYDGCTNLRELWDNAVAKYGHSNCQGTRAIERVITQKVTFTNSSGNTVSKEIEKWVMADSYAFKTYNEVNKAVVAVGAGLWNKLTAIQAGLPDGESLPEKRIGIYAESKSEWTQAAFGAFRHGIPIVTVYATLGVPAVGYAVTQTDVSIMVCDAELVHKLLDVKAGQSVPTGVGSETYDAHARSLKCVVYIGDPALIKPDTVTALEEAGVELMSFDALVAEGKANPVADTPETLPTPESIANIQYTSGSTGLPKGVVIRHKHLVAGVAGTIKSLPGLNQSDSYIAYLPLAHILELLAELCMYASGAAVGYASKETLVASSRRIPVPDAEAGVPVVKGDAACLAPTVMAAVPAVMEKIRKGISAKVAAKGAVTSWLFNTGMESKRRALSRGNDAPFWNFLLFDKIRTEALGGRVRMMISGGGPLNKETQQFMNIVFCCPVGQGYGLTETMGGSTIVWPHDRDFGLVGPPTAAVDIKLRDWPEGGYFANADVPRGEVLIAGGTVADGYFEMPEKTAQDFVADPETGRVWFATGDVGEFTPQGVLKIIDRKKDLVKLINGEYISLGKIESTLALCPYLTAILAYGDGEASKAVAVITPDVDKVRQEFPDLSSVEDMAASAELKKAILADMKRIGQEKGFQATEIPSAVHIATEEWLPETGLVTASLKLKRKQLVTKYNDDIQALYGRTAGAAAQ